MDNEFKKVMAEKTNKSLVSIVFVEKKDYQPAALLAAKEELKKWVTNCVGPIKYEMARVNIYTPKAENR